MEKMIEYNNSYKILLEKLEKDITTDNLKYILDETYIFWNTHKNLIQLFLKNVPYNYNTYFFTGATFLDCDDYEHFPLVVLGKIHIIDDAVSKYIKVINSNMSIKFKKSIKEQIILAIKDNIKVLELNDSNIFVLPVTFFNQLEESQNIIIELANKFVLNLFKKENMTKKELFENYSDIETMQTQIKNEARQILIFSEYNDIDIELKERYIKYINNNVLPFNEGLNDVQKFYFIVYGFFLQALQIAFSCIEYNIIPYLRYDISFHYFTIVANNFHKEYGIDNILIRSSCANMIYKLFDKRRIKDKDFTNFHNNIYKLEINDTIFSFIKREKIDINNYDLKHPPINCTPSQNPFL